MSPVTDYGLSLDARIDVAFEGLGRGRLAGRLRGVDYARLRAEGRIDLDIRALIEAEDGHRNAQVWGIGTVNFATGKLHIEAYMQ